MGVREILSRTRSSLRHRADRLLLGLRQRPKSLSAVLPDGGRNGDQIPRMDGLDIIEWASAMPGSAEREWYQGLLPEADRILARRLSYFCLQDHPLGSPIDWHRDHRAGVSAPRRFAPSIDYRDFRVVGDCKQVWEPNRHHQLVVLARAHRASGERRYAEAVGEQLDSWLEQNPFGMGMNWRSPLELGIRLINWVWTIDLIRNSGVIEGELKCRLMNAVYRHVWDIMRKLSRASSANNHLIGEVAGAFIATSYFRGMKNAPRWRRRCREILQEEIFRQTHDDGGNKEQAVGYELFVLQFFLLSGLVARWSGEDFPPPYWSAVERMFEYIGALSEGGENVPMYGDCDDGYVLDLGCGHHDFRAWLSVGAILFGRGDFKAWSGGYSEPARWLLGRDGREKFEAIHVPDDDRIRSRAFGESGCYLLQCGRRDEDDRISVLFDCGPLGFGALAGHGHADALSLALRAFGKDVLVDPGTYDYFTYPEWRSYFRSTRAHNTVVIDAKDQSEMLGPFLWGRRASARCIEWKPDEFGGLVVGEHDGYRKLRDPVIHRRTLRLDSRKRELTIRDDIIAKGCHDLEVRLHLAEHCALGPDGDNRFTIDVGPGSVTMALDPRLSVETLHGSEDPIGGWVSRGYHQKTPSTTLIGRCSSEGNVTLQCRILMGQP